MIDSTNQTNRRAGRGATYHSHLQGPLEASFDIILATPPDHDARLGPAESEQSDGHDANAPPQRGVNLGALDAKVRDQWHESTKEVAHADGQGADERARGVGLGDLVVEAHEEIEQVGWGVVQGFEDVVHCRGWQIVGFEDVVHERRGLVGGSSDQLSRRGNCGSI